MTVPKRTRYQVAEARTVTVPTYRPLFLIGPVVVRWYVARLSVPESK